MKEIIKTSVIKPVEQVANSEPSKKFVISGNLQIFLGFSELEELSQRAKIAIAFCALSTLIIMITLMNISSSTEVRKDISSFFENILVVIQVLTVSFSFLQKKAQNNKPHS